MLDPHDTCAKEAGVSEVFEFQTSASCFYLLFLFGDEDMGQTLTPQSLKVL